jgi:hypothetical protein
VSGPNAATPARRTDTLSAQWDSCLLPEKPRLTDPPHLPTTSTPAIMTTPVVTETCRNGNPIRPQAKLPLAA